MVRANDVNFRARQKNLKQIFDFQNYLSNSLFIVHCSLFIVRCSLFIVHCPLLIIPITFPLNFCPIKGLFLDLDLM